MLLVYLKDCNTVLQMSKRMLKTLERTRFANSPIVAVAANPGSADQVNMSTQLSIDNIISPETRHKNNN